MTEREMTAMMAAKKRLSDQDRMGRERNRRFACVTEKGRDFREALDGAKIRAIEAPGLEKKSAARSRRADGGITRVFVSRGSRIRLICRAS